MRRLILNADDFGLTSGVNRAIVELHQADSLTSATLMANAEAMPEAVSLAQQNPNLGVGCHVVLVDGLPTLPAKELPTLVDPRTGRFRKTLGQFVKDLLLGRIRATEIEAEATAQITRLQQHGITPTHLDTHKHTHMFPAVLLPVLGAALRTGVPAIRNPFEPDWSLAATPNAPWQRRTQVKILRSYLPNFRKQVTRAGIYTTDGAVGVLATGTLDPATVESLLKALPAGTWELVTHPGYNDAALQAANTRLLASRETELRALNLIRNHTHASLISFAAL